MEYLYLYGVNYPPKLLNYLLTGFELGPGLELGPVFDLGPDGGLLPLTFMKTGSSGAAVGNAFRLIPAVGIVLEVGLMLLVLVLVLVLAPAVPAAGRASITLCKAPIRCLAVSSVTGFVDMISKNGTNKRRAKTNTQ